MATASKTKTQTTETENTEAEGTALVVAGAAGLPDFLDVMEQHAGLGTSQAADDNIVPIITILQALSPQVQDGKAERIEGAKAGHIFIKNSDEPLATEIIFQPCYYFRKVVEWVPRHKGGGFVAHHDEMPADVEERIDNEGKKKMVRKSNGNECIDTRYHVGHLLKEDGSMLPYVIPLSSSGHQVSRQWHTFMNAVRLPSGAVPPSFARSYKLKTVMKTKNNNSWYTFDVSSVGWVDKQQFERGLALHESFKSGEKNVDTSQPDEGSASTGEQAPF